MSIVKVDYGEVGGGSYKYTTMPINLSTGSSVVTVSGMSELTSVIINLSSRSAIFGAMKDESDNLVLINADNYKILNINGNEIEVSVYAGGEGTIYVQGN